jgi:hypothetical protein
MTNNRKLKNHLEKLDFKAKRMELLEMHNKHIHLHQDDVNMSSLLSDCSQQQAH